MELKITPSGQTIAKPTALGPGANTGPKLLIYGLFQKGRVLAQDGVYFCSIRTMCRILEQEHELRERRNQLRHPNYQKPELLATAPNQEGMSRPLLNLVG